MRAAWVLLLAAFTGCVPRLENGAVGVHGQAGVLVFTVPQALALGDSFPISAQLPVTTGACPAGRRTVATSTPAVLGVDGVMTTSTACEVTATMHGLSVGHAQVIANIGSSFDTFELWVEAPDHALITQSGFAVPLHATVVHVSLSRSTLALSDAGAPAHIVDAWIGLDVRSANEVPLGYATPPSVVTSPTGIVEVSTPSPLVQAPGLIGLIPRALGTATLTATIFGLSDSITVIVDP
jgi:hypothetical protein